MRSKELGRGRVGGRGGWPHLKIFGFASDLAFHPMRFGFSSYLGFPPKSFGFSSYLGFPPKIFGFSSDYEEASSRLWL